MTSVHDPDRVPPPLERARDAALRVWGHRVAGPVVKSLGAFVAVVVGVEVLFGRREPVPGGLIVTGMVIGSLYALVAFGLILVYRANRIVSFAQAGLGSVPAVLAVILLSTKGWSYPVVVAILLVGAVAVGVAVDLVVVQRFAQAPRLILTVATIGVAQLLALLELYLPVWVIGQAVYETRFDTPWDGLRFRFMGQVFNGNDVAIVVTVTAIMIGLGLFFRHTRIGIAARASAENGERAALLGIPVRRVSTVVWAIAALCSAIGVFLRAPVVGLPLGGLIGPEVLLFGLAAAVVARMESLPVALGAGMAIGIIDQAATFGNSRPVLNKALMLPIILGALLLQRRRLARAFDTGVATWKGMREFRPIPQELRGLAEVKAARVVGAVLVGALFLSAPYLFGTIRADKISVIVIYSIVGVSLVVLTGWAGQISLGQFGFVGLGAAVAGGLAADAHADFFVTIVAAGIVGALFAVLVGLPALRVQGLFLAVTTLAFAAAVHAFALDRSWFGWVLPEPENRIERPVLYGRIDTTSPVAFYYVCLAFLVLVYLSARAIRASRSGRVMVAVRDNPRTAQSFGVNLARTRLAAFAISGFYAAVAGALLAYQQNAVDQGAFNILRSLDVFVFTVVGGLTSLPGAILGAVYYLGTRYLGTDGFGLNNLDILATGIGVLVLLLVLPGGLTEGAYRIRDGLLRWVADRRGLHVPSLVADRRVEEIGRADARDGAAVAVVEADVEPETPAPVPIRTAGAGPPPEGAPILVCEGVEVAYGQVQVLFGVDLVVHEGEMVALLGTNGAGKSTLLKAVSGLVEPMGGRITFEGRDITGIDALTAAKLGIVQMPGGKGVFPTLTVDEHFTAACWLFGRDKGRVDQARDEALDRFPRLRERRDQLAGNLSGGEQQMLALAMAFVAKPRLLMIDELSIGLAPTVVSTLLDLVREIHAQGTTVVLVEQSLNVALTLADRAFFMEKGEVRFEGPTAELVDRPDLVRSVFLEGAASVVGDDAKAKPARRAKVPVTAAARADRVAGQARAERAVVLEAVDLQVGFGGIRAVDGVDLVVRDGEIIGLIGPNGAGKTTVFDLLSGFVLPDSGRVLFQGVDVTDWSPDRRAFAGLGRSFQDARVFPSLTVAECLANALERHLAVRDHVAAALGLPCIREVEEDVAWTVEDLVELMGLGAFRDKFVGELSTGSRRVVDLAMAIAHDPTVLLLDEPASGVAQRETEALGPLLARIRRETGCAMLVVEHDMPLITSIADEIVAMELGRPIARGPADEIVRDPRVVAAYLGTDEAVIRRSGATAGPGNGKGNGRRSAAKPRKGAGA